MSMRCGPSPHRSVSRSSHAPMIRWIRPLCAPRTRRTTRRPGQSPCRSVRHCRRCRTPPKLRFLLLAP
eukprot:1496692-Prymnesium_polylepis.1